MTTERKDGEPLPWVFRKGGKLEHAGHKIDVLEVDGDEITIRDNSAQKRTSYIITRQGLERFLNDPNPFPKSKRTQPRRDLLTESKDK